MNGEYDNELRGALFKNQRKRPDKQDPDYNGSLTVQGVEYWVSSWINTNKKDGSKYMSLVLKPKDQQAQSSAPVTHAKQDDVPFDDDIPFAFLLAPLAGVLAYAAHATQAMF